MLLLLLRLLLHRWFLLLLYFFFLGGGGPYCYNYQNPYINQINFCGSEPLALPWKCPACPNPTNPKTPIVALESPRTEKRPEQEAVANGEEAPRLPQTCFDLFLNPKPETLDPRP